MTLAPVHQPLPAVPVVGPTAAAADAGRGRVLALSTAVFTLLFAVWLMFGILAIPVCAELNLTDVQFSWLTAAAILNGSVWRLPFGMLADRVGGRRLMTLLLLATAVPTAAVAFAQSYPALLTCAFLLGLSGNGFSIGVAWNSAWWARGSQGAALGVFGAGNVGASVTKIIGPAIIAAVPAGLSVAGVPLPGGWRAIPLLYAAALVAMAVAVSALSPADRRPGRGRPLADRLRPLAGVRVWRFSLYYVVVFGAYVALSAFLPKYYRDVYGASLPTAAYLSALFIFPASLLRPVGGWLSDRFGARRLMYGVFGLMGGVSLLLAVPPFHMSLDGGGSFHFSLGITGFTVLMFLLGVGMGVGKAAVYKYIPEYFPRDVAAVGGLVGTLGALGGFALPPLFAYAKAGTHLPQSAFALLFLLTAASFLWLHLTVLRLVRAAAPRVRDRFEFQPTA
jgi:NNP family nitrate/nitrite transporter-like MFS transporter